MQPALALEVARWHAETVAKVVAGAVEAGQVVALVMTPWGRLDLALQQEENRI